MNVPMLRCDGCGLPSYAGRWTMTECPGCGEPLRPPPRMTASATSPQERGLAPVLSIARENLGMEVAFVGEVHNGRETVRAVVGDVEAVAVATGFSAPLEETFCQHLLSGQLNVVRDAHEDDRVRDLPPARDLGVRSYIGVPLTARNARLYVLCCLSREARPALSEADVWFLRGLGETVLAELDAA